MSRSLTSHLCIFSHTSFVLSVTKVILQNLSVVIICLKLCNHTY